MKYLWSAMLIALITICAACGNNNNSSNPNVSGNWSVALLDANGNQQFSFTTSLTQSSNNSVSGENLTFTTNSACFANGGTETGALTISGNTSGVTTAGLQLTITSTGASAGNTMTLNGTFQNNTVSGTWTLNGGVGCTGNGTFSMTKVS